MSHYTSIHTTTRQKQRLDEAKTDLFGTEDVSYRIVINRLLDDADATETDVNEVDGDMTLCGTRIPDGDGE
ncbi:hypothetical protein [Halarchaeum salinum]|uniref:Uncharacterized protein n=1 Tax=Halarchaeum salinum TaxID=489912 RepID=A0AAV3S9W4_9EURY